MRLWPASVRGPKKEGFSQAASSLPWSLFGRRDGPFGERQERGADDGRDRTLRARVEFADGFDGVAEKFDADGTLRFGREDVDDAAADGELAGELDHFGAGVADGAEMEQEIVERNLDVAGESAGEGEIDVGILIAPERGGDRRDHQGDLAVGEAEERGGAALENVGVGALRLPGQVSNAGSVVTPPSAPGKMPAKKRSVSARASARRLDSVTKNAGRRKFVRDVSGDERFGYVVQAGERDVIAAGTQGGERAFHRRMAQTLSSRSRTAGRIIREVIRISRRGGVSRRRVRAFANLS